LKIGSLPITSAPAAHLDQGCEGVIDIALVARSQDMKLKPEGAGRRPQVSR
jgi:hypothetical protein